MEEIGPRKYDIWVLHGPFRADKFYYDEAAIKILMIIIKISLNCFYDFHKFFSGYYAAFSYISMAYWKLSNVVFSFTLIIHAWLVNINILMRLENNETTILKMFCDLFIDNNLSTHFEDHNKKSIHFVSKMKAKNVRKLNM